MTEVKKDCRRDAPDSREGSSPPGPQPRRRQSARAIVTIIADLRGREGTAPTTLCEGIGIRALCNVIFGVISRYQRADNLREGIGIRASSTTLPSNKWRSFFYSRRRYFETSGISW